MEFIVNNFATLVPAYVAIIAAIGVLYVLHLNR
jgi:hypothetical protein